MQPDIPALDRFFITFATSLPRRLAAWTAVGALLALARSWLLVWLAPVPLLMQLYGIWVLKQTHSTLEDKLAEALVQSGRKACDLTEDQEAFGLRETSGSLHCLMLASLPDAMDLTLIAPLENYALISRHSGTIFPPRWLHPLEFHHKAGSQTEIYYADVNYVEYEDDVLTLHFSNGKTFAVAGGNGGAEAVAALRTRLREHKSRKTAH